MMKYLLFGVAISNAQSLTCGDIKTFYNDGDCCESSSSHTICSGNPLVEFKQNMAFDKDVPVNERAARAIGYLQNTWASPVAGKGILDPSNDYSLTDFKIMYHFETYAQVLAHFSRYFSTKPVDDIRSTFQKSYNVTGSIGFFKAQNLTEFKEYIKDNVMYPTYGSFKLSYLCFSVGNTTEVARRYFEETEGEEEQ